ncbi:DUF411 domain-containing protein [Fulvimarina sp. 2208YS6-2-32]|uniref:DUF411 domain-containing protein n=1 Tax=Fulvimarina uroteuthidis TaxID=3098149 RepID=A0ABU5I7B4_9HYPH|nr:DUF411 domain-containing protein [Fulvimarina sp. 2208YS6-2-32]MDY8111055.1 DUF411 domain-containing protein [Fulvimarina sp. 2208YS6-2-32]
MTARPLTRRALLLGGAAFVIASTGLSRAFAAADPVADGGTGAAPNRTIAVFASPSCGCCKGWVEHVRANGYAADVTYVDDGALNQRKDAAGLTAETRSCHTGFIAGYVIEGHVPAAEIDRLLAARPEALGLSVPGMPMDAPGMGTGSTPYEVLLLKADGTSEVFARYPMV